MQRSLRRIAFLALTVLAAAACGEDDVTGTTGDALSADESAALAAALAGIAFDDAQSTPPETETAVAPSPARTHGGAHFEATIEDERSPCPLGGERIVNATLVIEGASTPDDTATVTLDGSTEFDACANVIDHDDGTTQIVVDSPDGLDVHIALAFTDDMPVGPQIVTYDGGFAWEAEDGRAGTCGVDVRVDFELHDAGSGTQTVTGRFCGHVLDRTLTWDDVAV